MKSYNIFMLIFIVLVLTQIHLASAQQSSLGVFKQGDCITLLQTCDSCTYNTITSVYAGKNKVLGQVSMTQIGTEYNATFCNTTQIGEYNVNGFGDLEGTDTIWNYVLDVTPTGEIISNIQIVVYILFLAICVFITYFSVSLIRKNTMAKDLSGQEKYSLKKKSEVLFYLAIMKKKLWIAGVFGIYISLLIFLAILNEVFFILGLNSLHTISDYAFIFFGWGLIPFVIFWIAWLILSFFKASKDMLQHEFGVGDRE